MSEGRHGPRPLAARMVDALRLDRALFAEVAAEPEAITQALVMVALAGLARGIGALPYEGFYGLVGGTLAGFLLWLLCAAAVWAIGVGAFAGRADYPELLRTLGFASAPLFALVLTALPLGPGAAVIWWAAHLMALVAFTIAVRESLELPSARALLVCALSLGLGLLALLWLGILFVASPAAA
jgi:hypothetical protein